MSINRELKVHGSFKRFRPYLLSLLFGMSLAACGGGDDGGGGSQPPAPPAPPPPGTPPVSTTPVSLDARQQIGASHWSNGPTSTGGTGQPVGGLDCGGHPTTFHQHTHLSIFLNGQALAIPANIGIVNTSPTTQCFYVTHTHDLTGMIHMNASAAGTFTLGQFFAVWGQQVTSSNVADLTGMPVTVYVVDNGTVTVPTDWPSIELRSHREITIQVGTAITEIPNFTWTGN